MVFLPPRHGKSELVSRRFPAFVLGRNPDARVIGTSYSGSLASSMNRDVQRIIESPKYQELFPNTKLGGMQSKDASSRSYLRNSSEFEVVGHSGSYLSAGISGSLTGYGADYAIIDDPIKTRKEAESIAYRNSVYDWFTSTLYTRLEKDACILITLTRWHEDDLAGRLLRLAKDDPNADQWVVINYPAIYESSVTYTDPTDPRKHGEALWPEKYNIDRLNTIKATIGSYDWSALYQQSPSPPGGAIFQRDWMQFYKQAPTEFDFIMQSWDFTFKDTASSDFVVGQVWGRKEANYFLLDQIRAQLSFTNSIKAILTMTAKWPRAIGKIVEEKANGPAIINSLRGQISGLIPFSPQGSKVERAQSVTPLFEAENVYLPHPGIAPWVHDYIEELVSFPNGLNDDQVDATSQALLFLSGKRKQGRKIRANVY